MRASHRLDRPVSGIVLFGLNPDIVRQLQAVWHTEATVKEYLALVKGYLDKPGCFDFPLLDESKRKQEAETPLRVLAFPKSGYIRAAPAEGYIGIRLVCGQ